MGRFAEKVQRMVIVQTPIAIRFSSSTEQSVYTQYIKQMSRHFKIAPIDPTDYGFDTSISIADALSITGVWVIVYKKRLPGKEAIKEALARAIKMSENEKVK